MDRLEAYSEDSSVVSKKAKLVQFPPDFQPIPCRPLFFDLALNHVEMPSLEHKLEQKKAAGGITGIVKGWFWGSGKKWVFHVFFQNGGKDEVWKSVLLPFSVKQIRQKFWW